MSNTITAYNTFVDNTKAKASEVNLNFSNHRSDLVPINPTTATASDATHNLGSSEHQWKNMYLSGGLFVNGSVTSSLSQIAPNATNIAANSLAIQSLETYRPQILTLSIASGYGGYTSAAGTFIHVMQVLNRLGGAGTLAIQKLSGAQVVSSIDMAATAGRYYAGHLIAQGGDQDYISYTGASTSVTVQALVFKYI